jgi:hypothetical protein
MLIARRKEGVDNRLQHAVTDIFCKNFLQYIEKRRV